jgi:hypothetical protein
VPGAEIDINPTTAVIDKGSDLFEVCLTVQIYRRGCHDHETGFPT